MYVLVLTGKKSLNMAIIMFLFLLLILGIYNLVVFSLPEYEITLEQRISVILPGKTEMNTIYMKTSNLPSVETGSLAGVKWKTEIIQQPEMSDINFKYPETIRLDEIKNLGHDISIHMSFNHTDKKLYGFFQVWNMKQPLDEFLSTSKKYSSMTFIDFKQSEIKVRNLKGFLWEYVYMGKDEDIICMEAFL